MSIPSSDDTSQPSASSSISIRSILPITNHPFQPLSPSAGRIYQSSHHLNHPLINAPLQFPPFPIMNLIPSPHTDTSNTNNSHPSHTVTSNNDNSHNTFPPIPPAPPSQTNLSSLPSSSVPASSLPLSLPLLNTAHSHSAYPPSAHPASVPLTSGLSRHHTPHSVTSGLSHTVHSNNSMTNVLLRRASASNVAVYSQSHGHSPRDRDQRDADNGLRTNSNVNVMQHTEHRDHRDHSNRSSNGSNPGSHPNSNCKAHRRLSLSTDFNRDLNRRPSHKRKRSRRSNAKKKKKKNNENEDLYYYQLENACGLEVESPGLGPHEEPEHAQAPSPRFGHVSCIHEDHLYVFGGRRDLRNYTPFDSTLYRYHLVTKKWEKIIPNLNPLYRKGSHYNLGNPQPQFEPQSAVTGATAVVYDDAIWIFGGYHHRYTNQMLKYDIYQNYWCVVDARGDIPQRRWEYSACVYRDKLYIFGGTLDRTHFNDLYSFDFDTLQWTELQPVNSSNVPRPRRRHKAVVYKHKMYVFGGREEPPVLRNQPNPQDLQIYDFRTSSWSRISCADSASSISIPIALNHSLYVHKPDGLLYVFGCQDAPVVTYDFKLNRWYPVSSRNYERHGLSLCTTHHGNVGYWGGSLYFFGGQSRDQVVQGQLLKFSLNPQPQYTRDMLSMLNNPTVSDIQFKISYDNSVVYAHKFMLMSRCEYFKRMFGGNFAESKESQATIHIDHCSRKVFLAVLRYFYTDELWNPTNVNDTLEMLGLADLYQFKIMRQHCCKILQNSLRIGNAVLLLQASRKFNLPNLKHLCKDFILANFAVYQCKVGLMADLIELIQLHSLTTKKNKISNDKQEQEDDEDNNSDNGDNDGNGDSKEDNPDNEIQRERDEWTALHHEIMDAVGKLFCSADNRILSERQKRLQVKLTKKDIEEYKRTHREMVAAAKSGCKNLISRRKRKEITTLDDDESENENEGEHESEDDDDDGDNMDSDDDDEDETHLICERGRSPKRRRLNNLNRNNEDSTHLVLGNDQNGDNLIGDAFTGNIEGNIPIFDNRVESVSGNVIGNGIGNRISDRISGTIGNQRHSNTSGQRRDSQLSHQDHDGNSSDNRFHNRQDGNGLFNGNDGDIDYHDINPPAVDPLHGPSSSHPMLLMNPATTAVIDQSGSDNLPYLVADVNNSNSNSNSSVRNSTSRNHNA